MTTGKKRPRPLAALTILPFALVTALAAAGMRQHRVPGAWIAFAIALVLLLAAAGSSVGGTPRGPRP
ncbi:MAG: hypothetical protein J2P26_04420 [Nocardiopsaceae bacterium]|nr:hypothetical protein [Nocardiopsaceae bacterium]